MEDQKKPAQENAPVVFKLSDQRAKVKKKAAKELRDLIRQRTREPLAR